VIEPDNFVRLFFRTHLDTTMNEDQLQELEEVIGVDGADHIRYLQDTLIPDLIESDMTATAADFKATICVIRQLIEARS